ncbi:MAG: hypothetical protein WCO60_00085 [Verrucomicrobiota bacterium]
MTRRPKLSILTVIGGVLLAPPIAFAHSGDILLARLVLQQGHEVTLQITADLEANPHLKNTQDPASALGESLRVILPGGRSWSIRELGKPTITVHNGFPFAAPVPLQHQPEEKLPELYTASWTWRPSESPLRFEVPTSNPHTVAFWNVAPNSDSVAPNWRMLLAGDSSNPIPLPVRPSPLKWNWQAAVALTVAGAGLSFQAFLLLRRLRKTKLS